MPIPILVFSDYVRPWCFLAESPLKQATEGITAQIESMPFELHPAPTPKRKPEDNYLQTAWKRRSYPIAEKLGVSMKLPTVPPYPYTSRWAG